MGGSQSWMARSKSRMAPFGWRWQEFSTFGKIKLFQGFSDCFQYYFQPYFSTQIQYPECWYHSQWNDHFACLRARNTPMRVARTNDFEAIKTKGSEGEFHNNDQRFNSAVFRNLDSVLSKDSWIWQNFIAEEHFKNTPCKNYVPNDKISSFFGNYVAIHLVFFFSK